MNRSSRGEQAGKNFFRWSRCIKQPCHLQKTTTNLILKEEEEEEGVGRKEGEGKEDGRKREAEKEEVKN